MKLGLIVALLGSAACQGKIEAGPAPGPGSGPPRAALSAEGYAPPSAPPPAGKPPKPAKLAPLAFKAPLRC